MIEIDRLTFAYRRRNPVFDNLSLRIADGGIYGLLGTNGAGKSTLLYLIAGLLTPSRGKVKVNGIDSRQRRPSTLADIFIVPEEFSLPSIKLEKYAAINGRFYPRFSAEDMRRHLATFDMTPDLHLGSLSMGQKKKAFMSFALACNTPIMLLDEPTNGLDIPGKSRFRKFIVSSMSEERTIVISTHQVRDIDRILDHVIVMADKEIALDKPVSEITRELKFMTTTDPEVISRALVAMPSVEGTNVIVPNTDGSDSEINLETLFELATARRRNQSNPQLPIHHEAD